MKASLERLFPMLRINTEFFLYQVLSLIILWRIPGAQILELMVIYTWNMERICAVSGSKGFIRFPPETSKFLLQTFSTLFCCSIGGNSLFHQCFYMRLSWYWTWRAILKHGAYNYKTYWLVGYTYNVYASIQVIPSVILSCNFSWKWIYLP